MINYYEILGLQPGAGVSEVKAAFRQLAKLYHPDVNPNGKEQFTRILKAYEVLSDPNLKYSYDYKLNAYKETAARQKEQDTPVKNKNWRFDERELKRRQYYNEHIKKYERKNSTEQGEPLLKSTYNEFKYILLATPLAVILFLGIMTFSTDNKELKKKNPDPVLTGTKKTSDLHMGDAPFDSHFGPALYDTNANASLLIKNLNQKDVVVCLFSADRYLRSFFIEAGYSADVAQLPVDAISIRYSSGSFFNNELKNPNTTVKGGFTENRIFYESNSPFRLNSVNELTLLDEKNEGFRVINAAQFFRK